MELQLLDPLKFGGVPSKQAIGTYCEYVNLVCCNIKNITELVQALSEIPPEWNFSLLRLTLAL